MKFSIELISGYWVVFKDGVILSGDPAAYGWRFTQFSQAASWLTAHYERYYSHEPTK